MEQKQKETPPREGYLLGTVKPKSTHILTQDDWDVLERVDVEARTPEEAAERAHEEEGSFA